MTTLPPVLIEINLTPRFSPAGEADYLSVKMKFSEGGLPGGLQGGRTGGNQSPGEDFRLALKLSESKSNGLSEQDGIVNLQAFDENGTISIQRVSRNWAWVLERAPNGFLFINYEAKPVPRSKVQPETMGIVQDNGGLIGVGGAFILLPMPPADYQISLSWDLSTAPPGTRAVTNLGEGDLVRSGRKDVITDCIFAVGPVQGTESSASTLPMAEPPSPEGGSCATYWYWFGDLPANLGAVREFCDNMFPQLAHFFSVEKGSHRTFLRNVPSGQKGLPLGTGSLLSYDAETQHEHDWELVRMLNLSMVGTLAVLDPEDNGDDNDWFRQGLSLLYTIYLPFRFKQRSADYFRDTLNGYLTSYFTNPFINEPLDAIERNPSSKWHAESATAMRACLYMIRADALMRRASVSRDGGRVARPIDEIAAALSTRRRHGETVQTKDWLRLVARWVGDDVAADEFRKMRDGGVPMGLDDIATAFGGSLVLEEQNEMEMGFARISLADGVVSGLVDGSTAKKAGLEDGDEIVWHSRVDYCERHHDAKFRLTVRRNASETKVEYWPRGNNKVNSWQSRKKDS